MTQFNRPQQRETPATAYTTGHNCAAFGCPLPGSLSEGIQGGGNWYCRNHFGSFGAAHDEITVRIKKHRWILDIASYLSADMQNGDGFEGIRDGIEERFAEAGLDLAMDREKTVGAWVQKISGKFDSLVSGSPQGAGRVVARASAETQKPAGFARIDSLIPAMDSEKPQTWTMIGEPNAF